MTRDVVLPRLHAVVVALRNNGARPAPQDVIDATRALEILGDEALSSREALRATLACTLARSISELEVFDRVFDLFFGEDGAALDAAITVTPLVDALVARGVSRQRAEQLVAAVVGADGADALLAAAIAGDDERLADLFGAAVEGTDFEGLTTSLQLGYFTRRLMIRLGVDEIEGRLGRAAGGAGEVDGRALGGASAELIDGLRRAARRAAQRELEKRTVAVPRRGTLADRDLRALEARDLEDLRTLVRRLAQGLRARVIARRRRARRGKVDVRRTLRRSVATGGVPLRVELARRRKRRTDLVVLCDVSDSVRHASLFMLELVAALSDVFRRTRSFVFVDRVGEVTGLFAGAGGPSVPKASPDAAIAAILAGDVVPVSNNSDYGRALRELYAIAGLAITRRTTVVILGDGRSNYRPPEDWVLGELRRRAQRLVWLSPEDRGTWGYGDSELPRFARHADAILVVRTAADLARAIDKIAVM